MAIGPIQYLPQAQQFGPQQGLAIGNVISQMRSRSAASDLAAKQQQQAEELKAQYQKDIQSYIQNPTPIEAARLSVKYPQQREAFKQASGLVSDEQRQNEIKITGQVYAALSNGNVDVATDILNQRITALDNSGEDTSDLVMLRDNMQSNPDNAKALAGMYLSSIMEPDKFIDTYGKLGEEERKQKLQPGEIKKQNAELKKYASDLELNNARTNKVLAETRKLDAETRKSLIELEASKDAEGRIIDPEKKNKAERDLRKEYSSEVADFTKTQDAFRKIDAAEDTAVGDLSLIFSFMKMLDPGSVVREGEFATAQNAAGVDEKIINLYNNVITGERLNEGQRKKFKSQAKSLMNAAQKREKETRDLLMNPIKNYGLNPDNVFGIQEQPAEEELQTAPALPQGAKQQEDGSILFPDGSVYRP